MRRRHRIGERAPLIELACLALHERGGGPLHYEQIAGSMEDLELVRAAGPSLPRSVQTRICEQIRELGDKAWFQRAGPGLFALTDSGRALWADDRDA